MAFVSDAQLLSDLADTLKKPEAQLQAYWTRIVSQSHAWAYQYIVNCLLGKGFLIAQITQWDSGPHYERLLTLWMALTRGGGLEGYDDKFLKQLDCRDQLKELRALEISGVAVNPEGTAGLASTGAYDTTDDIFVWPDPDDTAHRGEPIRW